MFTSSNLELDPPTGRPGQIVTVRWRLGSDTQINTSNHHHHPRSTSNDNDDNNGTAAISSSSETISAATTGPVNSGIQGYSPTIDDEIRMTTSSGELLSRISLDFNDHQQVQLRQEFMSIQQQLFNEDRMRKEQKEQEEFERQQQMLRNRFNNSTNNNTTSAGRGNKTSVNHRGSRAVTSFRQVLNSSPSLAQGNFSGVANVDSSTDLQSSSRQQQQQQDSSSPQTQHHQQSSSSTLKKRLYGMLGSPFQNKNNSISKNNLNENSLLLSSQQLSLSGGLSASDLNSPLSNNNSITSNNNDLLSYSEGYYDDQQNNGNNNDHTTGASSSSLLAGERCLRCPPLAGGFIVSLYRCSGEFQRILSVPYRVEHSKEEEDDDDQDDQDGDDNHKNDESTENESENSIMMSGTNNNNKLHQHQNNHEKHVVISVDPVAQNLTTSIRRPLQTVSVRFKWSEVLRCHQLAKFSSSTRLPSLENSKIFGVPLQEAKVCSALVLCVAQSPDNGGFSTEGTFLDNNNFSHCARVVRLFQEGDSFVAASAASTLVSSKRNARSSSSSSSKNSSSYYEEDVVERHFVGPDLPGEYQCRLMVRAATNIFHTAAVSPAFTIHAAGAPEPLPEISSKKLIGNNSNLINEQDQDGLIKTKTPTSPIGKDFDRDDIMTNNNVNNAQNEKQLMRAQKEEEEKLKEKNFVKKKLFQAAEESTIRRSRKKLTAREEEEEEEKLLEMKLAKMLKGLSSPKNETKDDEKEEKTENTRMSSPPPSPKLQNAEESIFQNINIVEDNNNNDHREDVLDDEQKQLVDELNRLGEQTTTTDDNDDDLNYTESFLHQQDHFRAAQEQIHQAFQQQQQNYPFEGNQNPPEKWITTSELAHVYYKHGTFHDIDEIQRTNIRPVKGISPVAHAARLQRLQRFGRTNFIAPPSKSNNSKLHHHHHPFQSGMASTNASLGTPIAGLEELSAIMNKHASFGNHFNNNNINANNSSFFSLMSPQHQHLSAASFGGGAFSPSSFATTTNMSIGGVAYQNTAALQQALLAAAMNEPSIFKPENALSLEASRYRVLAGQYIRVKYDVRASSYGNMLPPPSDVNRRHLPCSLDHIRFVPYGRSEKDKYTGACSLTITGHSSHAGVICVKTPNVSGCFDLGFRRFTDNETLVLAEQPVVTDWPDGEIFVSDDLGTPSGGGASSTPNSFASASASPASSINYGSGGGVQNNINNQSNHQTQASSSSSPISAFERHESTVFVQIKPSFVASPYDRVIACDDTTAVVAFSFVQWDDPSPDEIRESEFDLTSRSSITSSPCRNGRAVLRIPISGRFNIRLFSARVGHVLPCKPKELLTVTPSMAYPLPYASLQALKRVPARAADIGISFVKLLDVEDLRPVEIQNRDAVVLVPYGHMSLQFTSPTHFDNPDSQKFLRCETLYNVQNLFVVFDIRNLKPARYVIRFMAATANPFVRVCTSECTFDICEKGSDDQFVAEHLATSGGEMEGGDLRDCDMHTSQQFIERLSTSELAPVRHLRRNAAEIASVARTQQSNKTSSFRIEKDENDAFAKSITNTTDGNLNENDDENENHNNQQKQRGAGASTSSMISSPSSLNAALALSPTSATLHASSLSSFVEKRKALLHGLATDPPFILPQPHEIVGHLLAPLTATAGDVFKIFVNIAAGSPRLNDLIVLCSEDLTKVFTQISLYSCMNYEKSSTDGVALLYAPVLPGKCVAVYYSQAAKGGLFQSNVIKIKKNAAQKQQKLIQQQQHQQRENALLNNNGTSQSVVTFAHQDHYVSGSVNTNISNSNNNNNNNTHHYVHSSDQLALHLRRIFDALARRRLSPDGLHQFSGDDAPLIGILGSKASIRQPPKLTMLVNSSFEASQHLQQHSPSSLLSPKMLLPSRNRSMRQQQQQSENHLPRLRILLVGVSYLKQRYDLDGPSNDVSAIFSFFKENFTSKEKVHEVFDPEKDARVLHELCQDPMLQPTASNIRRGFRWLVHDAQEDDHLVFYFSGSGALVPQIWNWYHRRDDTHSSANSNNNNNNNNNNNINNNINPSSSSSAPFLSTDVSQVLLPCDFDFGRRSISYREIIQDLYGKVAHLENITVTSIIDAGFTTEAESIMAQRRGVNLQDAAQELGQTLLLEERKRTFHVRTKCRCVPPPQPYPLVTIGADQQTIESPMVVMGSMNGDNNSNNNTNGVQPFILDGLSNVFVSSCSPVAVSYYCDNLMNKSSTSLPSPSDGTPLAASSSFLKKSINTNNNNNNDDEASSLMKIPKNSFFLEASRGGHSATDGIHAYDTFSRWAGVSMGLFTNTLVQMFHALVREKRDGLVGVNWFDLMERVQREMRKVSGGQYQLPILWTAKRGFFDDSNNNNLKKNNNNINDDSRNQDQNNNKTTMKSPFLMPVFPLAHDKEYDE